LNNDRHLEVIIFYSVAAGRTFIQLSSAMLGTTLAYKVDRRNS